MRSFKGVKTRFISVFLAVCFFAMLPISSSAKNNSDDVSNARGCDGVCVAKGLLYSVGLGILVVPFGMKLHYDNVCLQAENEILKVRLKRCEIERQSGDQTSSDYQALVEEEKYLRSERREYQAKSRKALDFLEYSKYAGIHLVANAVTL